MHIASITILQLNSTQCNSHRLAPTSLGDSIISEDQCMDWRQVSTEEVITTPAGNEICSLQSCSLWHSTDPQTQPTCLSSFFVIDTAFLLCMTKNSTLMTRLGVCRGAEELIRHSCAVKNACKVGAVITWASHRQVWNEVGNTPFIVYAHEWPWWVRWVRMFSLVNWF